MFFTKWADPSFTMVQQTHLRHRTHLQHESGGSRPQDLEVRDQCVRVLLPKRCRGRSNLLKNAGIIENPPEEAPGWHGSEVEAAECLYFEQLYGKKIVHLERTDKD